MNAPIFSAEFRCCDLHYLALRSTLRKKNLWRLCREDTQEREVCAKLWLSGTCPPHLFDPLVVCLLEIRQKVSTMAGGGLPVGCPLCGAMRLGDDERIPDSWIDNVTDAVLAVAHANGLMGKASVH